MKADFKSHPLFLFRDFRSLFAGRLISSVGDKFFAIALSWWVITETASNSKFHLGLLMGINFLPVVLFGPFLGTLVDRLNRKGCMLAADLIRFLAIGILCALLAAGRLNLPILYAICFFTAAFIPLFESAASSALVDLTDREHLPATVAVDSSVVQLSNVIGAALGSVFLAVLGVLGAFIANSLSFLASFFAVFSIKNRLAPLGTSEDYRVQFREGFRYLWENRPILCLLLVFASLNFFAAPLVIMLPMIVKFVLAENINWVAILEVCLSVGSVLMAILMSLKTTWRRIYPALFLAVLLMGFLLMGLALLKNKVLLCCVLFFSGVAVSFVNTLVFALFQRVVPAPMKGRFFALLTTICYAVIPLTLVLNGLFSELISLKAVLIFNATGTGVLSFLLLFIPRIQEDLS
jgi:MFS family permease